VPDLQSTGPDHAPTCLRCKISMVQVVHIDTFGEQPGLNAYECPTCHHLTSLVVEEPTEQVVQRSDNLTRKGKTV
jgi:hypothetical protein